MNHPSHSIQAYQRRRVARARSRMQLKALRQELARYRSPAEQAELAAIISRADTRESARLLAAAPF